MPHAIGMPSFLADEPELLLASSLPQFDAPRYQRNSYEKAYGNTRSSSHTSSTGSNGYETELRIDNNSNGDLLVMGFNIATKERPGSDNSHNKHQSSSMFSCNLTYSVAHENGRGISHNGTFQSHFGKSNTTSTNEHNQESVPVDRLLINGEKETCKKSFISVSTPPNAQAVSPSNHTTTPNSTTQTAPPNTYRFSYPVSYAKTNLPLNNTPSTNSPQSHTSSQLKSRHTLQIPKLGSTRTSADDNTYTSGRFSPTTPNSSMRRSSFNLTARNTQTLNTNVPHEEVPPDDNAILWAEAVRQKRASKRRRKDDEDEERVIVGTKVDQNHVNWVTAYNMLTGIRFTVSRTNAKIDRPLTNADFEARHKFSFDITGNELTPSAKYDFKFKDYAPWVFRHLRANFKLDPADYLMSLTSKYILSELGSPGKSGSFFYFSRDYKYIIKTIHHAEHKFLRKILKEYFAHVEANPHTLLSQFYGLHRVKMPYGRKIHFVVMNNLFPPHRDIHQTFDLKGSTIGRDYKEENLAKNPRATLKDLNWLRRNLHLEFGPEKRNIFFEQMEKDVHLLQRLGIMDYSMLVGIHNLQIGNQENLRDKTLQVFQPGGDNPSEEAERVSDARGPLMRTPSKQENARKARELRQIIKQEKPIPMGQSSSRMPDTLEQNPAKKELLFYSDDGGFQATHEDNSPGEQIFFLSIIDCLTHYGTVKKLEHFWKGLKYDKRLISPVSPDPYGERFVEFIEGITKSAEEAKREALSAPLPPLPTSNNDISNDISTSLDQDHNARPEILEANAMNRGSHMKEKENFDQNSHSDNHGDASEVRPSTANQNSSVNRTGSSNCQILPVVEEIGEASSLDGPNFQKQDSKSTASLIENISSAINQIKDSNVRVSISSIKSCDKELPPLPK
ncbi:Phosphatidylinositol 4-phosphate 5-kinase its3 [Golovinomyces cichoracearum]|uniref:1-phosphatidylinositol-4-phosphate 5-kinase n=1 Tax=Golovinomyces cichoracearum TaxID=62708 RepID=A0A420HKN4_9PEZI|nr:Phosphatidylinositol 4-phosphate 5-kinase its3 [Golovinomyces cichoracearum]